MDLEQIRDGMKRTISLLDKLLIETLEENGKFIEDLIRLQLQKGQKKGGLITPTYSKAYAAKKGFSVPNLKVLGNFYESIYTEAYSKGLIVDSKLKVKSFDLGQHLQKRYTEQILELTAQSLEKLKNKIIPEWLNKIQNEINR